MKIFDVNMLILILGFFIAFLVVSLFSLLFLESPSKYIETTSTMLLVYLITAFGLLVAHVVFKIPSFLKEWFRLFNNATRKRPHCNVEEFCELRKSMILIINRFSGLSHEEIIKLPKEEQLNIIGDVIKKLEQTKTEGV
jgi:hypothetical protein